MRPRRLTLTLAVVWLGVLLPTSALAGGWWTYVHADLNPAGVGETVTASAEVLFASAEEAREAAEHGRYHAYLLLDLDPALADAYSRAEPGDWWEPPDQLIHLGRVHVSVTDTNLARATAELVVPDVLPGSYGIMFCDEGCATPLADVVPSLGFEVLADATIAQLARDLDADLRERQALRDRLSDRMGRLGSDLRDLRHDTQAATAEVVGDTAALAEAVAALEARLDALPGGEGQRGGVPVRVAWFLAGAVTALAIATGFRSRRPPRPPNPNDADIPDDDAKPGTARRLVTLTLAVVCLVALLPATALASGGGWIDVDRDPAGIGETATARTTVVYETIDEAARTVARGGYHAYLLPDIDPADPAAWYVALQDPRRNDAWWQPPDGMVYLGPVELNEHSAPIVGSSLAEATARFVVPDVPPGRYAVMFCDTACLTPLRNITPSDYFDVLPDATLAQLSRDLAAEQAEREQLGLQLRGDIIELRVGLRDAGPSAAAAAEVAEETAALAEAVAALEARVAALPDGDGQQQPGWPLGVAWFLAGVVTALAIATGIRSRRRQTAPDFRDDDALAPSEHREEAPLLR